MRLFTLLQTRYDQLHTAVTNYIKKTISSYSDQNSDSTVFGQLLNVTESISQNILLYLEDSLTEQNKLTVQRKKSIYSLAAQSGYIPSYGSAGAAYIKFIRIPSALSVSSIIIPNRSVLLCTQNNLKYNIILDSDSIMMNDSSVNKKFKVVEGKFESQSFVSEGGDLYTIPVNFNGDTDFDYLSVVVNEEEYERADSLYDMNSGDKKYIIQPNINGGIYIIFGNSSHGTPLQEYDSVKVTYLLHSGEAGTIDGLSDCYFTFEDEIYDVNGETVSVSELYSIQLYSKDSIVPGTYSESIEQVKNMIGYNSRSLVLANTNNYKQVLSRFSFVGYNRTWVDDGTTKIHSIIVRDFGTKDYFSLSESDFMLDDIQKNTIYNYIKTTDKQLMGVTYDIKDPVIKKYACFIYLKMKDTVYDNSYVESQIKSLISNYMISEMNDLFIPKADFIHLIKQNISEVDSVDLYFMSEANEQAIKNGYYIDNGKKYMVYNSEDPGLGLDEYGNIQLTNNSDIPVLMGGWSYKSSDGILYDDDQYTTISDPIVINIV